MEAYLDCIPCILKQSLEAARRMGKDETIQAAILKESMDKLLQMNWHLTSLEMVDEIHAIIRRVMANEDPYKDVKYETNVESMKIVGSLKAIIDNMDNEYDRIEKAVLIALAGNIIDFGPLMKFDINQTLNEFITKTIKSETFEKFFEMLNNSDNLLFFADNSGEIVFDKLLIDTMIKVRNKPFSKITFVVKGGPILNDALIEDALYVGIDKIPNVLFEKIGNGQEGTGPGRNSHEVEKWIKEHEFIISKGQANFEGLNNNSNIFFLLIAKCPLIASLLNVDVNNIVLKYTK
jgi:damage-control phosphatase, subfamily I